MGGGTYKALVGKPQGRNHLEDLGVDRRMMFKFERLDGDGDIDLIDLAQDRDGWRALVYTVMNLRIP
jgi:hypothetical protein